MRILGIYLENIQTYTKPTLIPLSDTKTIISGGNDKGKSVLKKALGVFANIYAQSDYASLINYDKEKASVALFLSNRTVLMAYISRQTIAYALYNWQLDVCLKAWAEYTPEISQYLKWITIPEEELCLNLAESSVNVLVNTSKTTNTQIINSISTIPEIEMRLDNLKTALDEAKELNKWVQTEVQVQRRHCNFDELRYNNIKLCNDYIKNIYNKYNELIALAKLLYTKGDIYECSTEMKRNTAQINLQLSKDLCDYINLKEIQVRISQLKSQVGMIQPILNYINSSKDLSAIKVTQRLVTVQMSVLKSILYIEQILSYINVMKKIHAVKQSQEFTVAQMNIIKSLSFMEQISDYISKLKNAYIVNQSQIITTNQIGTVKSLLSMEQICNYTDTTKDLCMVKQSQITTINQMNVLMSLSIIEKIGDIVSTNLKIESNKLSININNLNLIHYYNLICKDLQLTKNLYTIYKTLELNMKFIYKMNDYVAVIYDYINNKKEMEKFDVCPLCHQPLNKSNKLLEGGHKHAE